MRWLINKSIKLKVVNGKNLNCTQERYSVNNCALLERAYIIFTYHPLSLFFFKKRAYIVSRITLARQIGRVRLLRPYQAFLLMVHLHLANAEL